MSLWKLTFNSSIYIPRSGVADSLDKSIFKLLRNYHPVFNNSCTTLHSHQQGTRLPISPHAPQHLFSVFCLFVLTVVLLTDVVYHCNFDWHFPTMSDGEHLFMCSLSSCASSLKTCLFKSSVQFWTEFFCCCCWILVVYIIWILTPC